MWYYRCMLANILLVITGLLLALGIVATGVAFTRQVLKPWIHDEVEAYVGQQLELFGTQFSQLSDEVAALPKTYEEERRESKRLRDRASYHVRRARAELADLNLEDGELEGLAGELRLIDASGSEDSILPDVRDGVAPGAEEKTVMQRAFESKWSRKYG